jgi:hypothetical protein
MQNHAEIGHEYIDTQKKYAHKFRWDYSFDGILSILKFGVYWLLHVSHLFSLCVSFSWQKKHSSYNCIRSELIKRTWSNSVENIYIFLNGYLLPRLE